VLENSFFIQNIFRQNVKHAKKLCCILESIPFAVFTLEMIRENTYKNKVASHSPSAAPSIVDFRERPMTRRNDGWDGRMTVLLGIGTTTIEVTSLIRQTNNDRDHPRKKSVRYK